MLDIIRSYDKINTVSLPRQIIEREGLIKSSSLFCFVTPF